MSRGEVIGAPAAVVWEAHGGGLLIDASEVRRFVSEHDATGQPQPIRRQTRNVRRATSIVGRDCSRSPWCQTAAGEKRASGWISGPRGREFVLTTADAVGRYEKADATFPLTQADGVLAEYAFYRDQQPHLLKNKGLPCQRRGAGNVDLRRKASRLLSNCVRYPTT